MKNILISIGKLKPKIKWLLIVAFVVFLALIFYFSLILPHKSTISKLKRTIADKTAERSRMIAIVKDKDYYQQRVEKLNREFKIALNMLPDKKEIPSLLKKISDEAENFGLEVYYFQPLPERKKDFYAEVPVAIKVTGTYHEVLGFFDKVNKFARIVNISDIQMNSSQQKSASDKNKKNNSLSQAKTELDISFMATTYRFLSEAERREGKRVKKTRRIH